MFIAKVCGIVAKCFDHCVLQLLPQDAILFPWIKVTLADEFFNSLADTRKSPYLQKFEANSIEYSFGILIVPVPMSW